MAGSEAFDAVVVGAGAAGCVVAARLAESGSRSVLLLEAGPDLRAEAPDEIRDAWHITRDFDWGYRSEPNPRGDVQNLWRNKLVGGTSWVTRFAPRGSPADYDEWAALGNAGWSFDDVLPYFRHLEADADFGDTPWHGDSGPMPVRRYLELEYTELGAAALQAFEEAGFPSVEDHNQPCAVGAGRMPMTSQDGRRVTTADAYLPVGATPPSLTIRPDTHVAEVCFEGNRARGVRLLNGDVVEASRVVLCAGVFGSPAILMRSGIGPADHLRSVEVPVRVDLPGVGANLADHPAVSIECGYSGATRTIPSCTSSPPSTAPRWTATRRRTSCCGRAIRRRQPKAPRASTSTWSWSGPVRGVAFACARPIPPTRRTSSSLPRAIRSTSSASPRATSAGSRC
jgi:choline dehydrogenase